VLVQGDEGGKNGWEVGGGVEDRKPGEVVQIEEEYNALT
jgi:hypothetical protein